MGEQGLEALHSKKPLESNVEIRENVCTPYEPRVLTVHYPQLKESQSKRLRKRGHRFRRETAGGGTRGGQERGEVSVAGGLQHTLPQHSGGRPCLRPPGGSPPIRAPHHPCITQPNQVNLRSGDSLSHPCWCFIFGKKSWAEPNPVSKKNNQIQFFPDSSLLEKKNHRIYQKQCQSKGGGTIFLRTQRWCLHVT